MDTHQAIQIQAAPSADTPIHTSTEAAENGNSHVGQNNNGSSSTSPNNPDGSRHRSRGFSLSIADIVSPASSARNSSNSQSHRHSSDCTNLTSPSSSPVSPPLPHSERNELSLQIDGGKHQILRPNRIVRGFVVLNAARAMQVSRIRVKFRAEEVATVKVREATLESKMERIDQMTTTLFEVDTKVWGNESSDFSVIPWDTLEAGEHKFPFALKLCNVNFPPSIEDPLGFSIRYVFSAHLDGPGFHPGLRSAPCNMPYRPIICTPHPQPWIFNEMLCKSDSKATPLARLKAALPQQAFCPDDSFMMNIEIECFPGDMIVKDVGYSLKKHFDGKLRIQQGTVFKSASRIILRNTLGVPGNDGKVELGIQFHLPTRQVSPSFASKHIRVYYTLSLHIALESVGRLLKKSTTHHVEASVPLAIANLPYDQLLRISNLTSVQSYRVSKEAPLFFDPSLDEPPATPFPGIPQDTPLQSPPNYFSLPTLPPQLQRTQRVERTVFTSRSIRPGQVPELGEPADIVEMFDDEW